MSNEYKFTFKKDDIYVEFDTTDKEALARQFQIWVTCASVYTYQHKRLEEQSQEDNSTQIQNVQQQVEPVVMPIEEAQTVSEEKGKTINDLQNPPKEEVSPSFEEFNHEEQVRNDFEYFMEKQNSLEEKKQEIAQTVEQAGQIGEHLDNLYNTEARNLNSLETFKEKLEDEDDFSNKTADFDKILELSMSSAPTETEVKKDDRFLKILNVKNVSNKLEYLIVTAYYLSEFEKMDKFTLKLINAKLMQNIKEAVDHNVLQEAIDKGLVEVLPSLPDIANSVEYRLTNAGEEAFLNGTNM